MSETTSPKRFGDYLQRQRSRAEVKIDGHTLRLIDVDVQRWAAWLDADELPEGVGYLDAGVADYVPSDALVYAVTSGAPEAWGSGLTDEDAAAEALADLHTRAGWRRPQVPCVEVWDALDALADAIRDDDPRAYAAAVERAYRAGMDADTIATSYGFASRRHGTPSFEWGGPEAQACDQCGAQPGQPCRPYCTDPAEV